MKHNKKKFNLIKLSRNITITASFILPITLISTTTDAMPRGLGIRITTGFQQLRKSAINLFRSIFSVRNLTPNQTAPNSNASQSAPSPRRTATKIKLTDKSKKKASGSNITGPTQTSKGKRTNITPVQGVKVPVTLPSGQSSKVKTKAQTGDSSKKPTSKPKTYPTTITSPSVSETRAKMEQEISNIIDRNTKTKPPKQTPPVDYTKLGAKPKTTQSKIKSTSSKKQVTPKETDPNQILESRQTIPTTKTQPFDPSLDNNPRALEGMPAYIPLKEKIVNKKTGESVTVGHILPVGEIKNGDVERRGAGKKLLGPPDNTLQNFSKRMIKDSNGNTGVLLIPNGFYKFKKLNDDELNSKNIIIPRQQTQPTQPTQPTPKIDYTKLGAKPKTSSSKTTTITSDAKKPKTDMETKPKTYQSINVNSDKKFDPTLDDNVDELNGKPAYMTLTESTINNFGETIFTKEKTVYVGEIVDGKIVRSRAGEKLLGPTFLSIDSFRKDIFKNSDGDSSVLLIPSFNYSFTPVNDNDIDPKNNIIPRRATSIPPSQSMPTPSVPTPSASISTSSKKTSSKIKEADTKPKKVTFSDKVQSQPINYPQVDESTLGAVGGFDPLDPNLLNSTR